jgi:hypothetical protein
VSRILKRFGHFDHLFILSIRPSGPVIVKEIRLNIFKLFYAQLAIRVGYSCANEN